MNQKAQTAITPTREEDYPEWYQQVVKAAELAENSPVRGCMVIKPWGYGIWELLQKDLDKRIKDTGHENAYFPIFIPLSLLEKEAAHVSGFAKECAVVTHHRLEVKNGKLVPTGELDEPLIVRPTSETIIGEMFSKWVKSYRDLPLLINQWANVVRWEMRTRLFLRTSEFLWQEGHTVHVDEADARVETMKMLGVYRDCVEEALAIPVILGEKPAHERFPGAVSTYCIEAMMQDNKALQAGTSHYLGQNFAKGSNIQFLDKDGEQKFPHTTSWGMSTRLIGGVIMTHGDDDGLRLPPRIAPKQIVIIPVLPKPEVEAEVFKKCDELAASLKELSVFGDGVRVTVDKRDIRGGDKSWSWIKKGAPIRIELGPKDIEKNSVVVYRRDKGVKDKEFISLTDLSSYIEKTLVDIQQNLFNQAKANLEKNIIRDAKTFDDLVSIFTPKNQERPEIHGGFVEAFWSEDPESVEKLDALKLTIRCILLGCNGSGTCILSGKPATKKIILAKTY